MQRVTTCWNAVYHTSSRLDDKAGATAPLPNNAFTNKPMSHPHQLRRITKVCIRAALRFAKIVLAILLSVIAAAIVLLGIFMALWEYWEREQKRESGNSQFGLLNSRLFFFLESITWLPRQIWGGLMLVATLLFFGFVFAGQYILAFASSNLTACAFVLSLSGLGLLAWVLFKEWRAEFSLAP